MYDLLKHIVQSRSAKRAVVCCRLVTTHGSTPQKAGAMMVVSANGVQAGTLGGGCVEAEVKRRALLALQRGAAEFACFQLDDDGWDDGLICGGRMEVLLDPLVDPTADNYFGQLADLVAQGNGGTEAIVRDEAKCGLPAPAWYLFDAAKKLLASRGGPVERGQAPRAVRDHLVDIRKRPRALTTHGIAYLPMLPRARLVIVGGGHVGKAVADLAATLDFDVWIVDDRREFVSQQRFPYAQRRLCGKIGEVLTQLEITALTYCLVVTRGHHHDAEALLRLVDRGATYVGMIGSRRKIRLIFDDLMQAGVAAAALRRVHAPVGIDIGSQTVTEIALSIAAELVAHRNCGGRVPGRPPPVAVTDG